MQERGEYSRIEEVSERADAVVKAYKIETRKFIASGIRVITLTPLAFSCWITKSYANLSLKLIGLAERIEITEKEREEPEIEEQEEIIIPSPVLREAFDILIAHGKDSKEWIVALGAQEIDGKLVITRVYDINCAISSSTHAEVDYSSLVNALRFYERCGYRIAGLAHIHPWNAMSVSPSSTDIKTHGMWEELYKGKFIGIVFTNSGVFRVFHAGKCKLKPRIVGKGVKRIGDGLYKIETVKNDYKL